MKFKRSIEPTTLKKFKLYMQKSIEELKQLAEESGIMLTPEMTKSEIIKKLFQQRGE